MTGRMHKKSEKNTGYVTFVILRWGLKRGVSVSQDGVMRWAGIKVGEHEKTVSDGRQ